jgi:tryptophanyl-tRNA synthetase
MKRRAISGMRPTNKIHLGNFLGALNNINNLECDEIYIFSADLHSLTTQRNNYKDNYEVIRTYISYLGVDKKYKYYIQSQFPQLCEFMWILACESSFGVLSRMTQFKEKGGGNAGLFTYPILMAADILAVDTNIVPVGADQKQHVEFARDLAQKINGEFGNIFVIPDMAYVDSLRIKDIRNPQVKMSKSSSSENGTVFMNDEDDVIRKKISLAVTDSLPIPDFYDEERLGIVNLMRIYKEIGGNPFEFSGGNIKTFKDSLSDKLVSFIGPIRERRKEISDDYIDQELNKNKEEINFLINNKLGKIKEIYGI